MRRTLTVFLFALGAFMAGYYVASVEKEAGPVTTAEKQDDCSDIEIKTASKFGGWYEVYKDKIGEWRWRLKAKGGEIIAQGEGYTNKRGVIDVIISLCKYAPTSPIK